MAEMAVKPKNKCECDKTTCIHTSKVGFCSDHRCKEYKSCCEPDCPGCNEKCAKGKCKCRIPRCGCETDCYKDGSDDSKCKGLSSNCERCKIRCQGSTECICYFCSCGTKCNGVICSCCSWCDSNNCSGEKCNGYVIGRCKDKDPGTTKCKGHVKYDNSGQFVWNRKDATDIQCGGKFHEGDCNDKCNKWASGKINEKGFCVIECTYCGTLCSQDWCRIWLGVLIIGLIILSCFIVMWGMFPETFHRITTGIRAALPGFPRHHGRSWSNLLGDGIPEDMNVDRYPAFRPRAYAGLA